MTADDRDDGVPRTLHDGMFKRVFSDPLLAADELRAVLPPALVARIDWPTLAPAPASFVDEVFRQRTGDLVFHAPQPRTSSTASRPGSTSYGSCSALRIATGSRHCCAILVMFTATPPPISSASASPPWWGQNTRTSC